MRRWIDFKEIRATIKIGDVLKSYGVELKVKGDHATAFCPLPCHKGRGDGKRHSPSFSVSLARNIFNCFSCGAKGNVIDLCAYFEGLAPNDPSQLRQAALKLMEKLGPSSGRRSIENPPKPTAAPAPVGTAADVPKPSGSAKPIGPPLQVVVNAPLDFELKHLDPKHPYLVSRGLTAETIAHFGLGFCSKGMMADRIAIPLSNAEGKLIGYAGRLVDDAKVSAENPKYRFPGARERAGVKYEFRKSEFLYNGCAIGAPVQDLVIVEGFVSVWWLFQHGYPHTVAVMGAACSEEQARLIIATVHPTGRVWILTDGDEAGERCTTSVLTQVTPHRFARWAKLDPGRQPTDCGVDELAKLLTSI